MGRPVHLIYNDPDSYRVAGRAAGHPVLFSDGYPLLLTSTASLQALRDAGRITSYNVCYTKLLRTISTSVSARSGARTIRAKSVGNASHRHPARR